MAVTVVGASASPGFTRGDIKRLLAQEYGYDPGDQQFGAVVADRINVILDELATMYHWRFLMQFGEANLELVSGQDSYNLLDLFPNYDASGFTFQQNTPYLLKYIPFREFFEKFPEQDLDGLSYFYTLLGGNEMKLWPTPSPGGTVGMAYYAQIPHLDSDGQRMFWRSKYDQCLLKGVRREMAAWRKDMGMMDRYADMFEMATRQMRLDDAVVPDWKMRVRMDRENRSRYGVARDNSRDWGWRY